MAAAVEQDIVIAEVQGTVVAVVVELGIAVEVSVAEPGTAVVGVVAVLGIVVVGVVAVLGIVVVAAVGPGIGTVVDSALEQGIVAAEQDTVAVVIAVDNSAPVLHCTPA